MRCVVTAVAGCVGSHLCELLLSQSDEVVGIDSFTECYNPSCKECNLEVAQGNESFTLWREDLVHDVVQAMRAAALSGVTGVANIGGGSRTSTNEVLEIAPALAGEPDISRLRMMRGDVRDTAADTQTAFEGFGYVPQVQLRRGLALMVEAERPAISV